MKWLRSYQSCLVFTRCEHENISDMVVTDLKCTFEYKWCFDIYKLTTEEIDIAKLSLPTSSYDMIVCDSSITNTHMKLITTNNVNKNIHHIQHYINSKKFIKQLKRILTDQRFIREEEKRDTSLINEPPFFSPITILTILAYKEAIFSVTAILGGIVIIKLFNKMK